MSDIPTIVDIFERQLHIGEEVWVFVEELDYWVQGTIINNIVTGKARESYVNVQSDDGMHSIKCWGFGSYRSKIFFTDVIIDDGKLCSRDLYDIKPPRDMIRTVTSHAVEAGDNPLEVSVPELFDMLQSIEADMTPAEFSDATLLVKEGKFTVIKHTRNKDRAGAMNELYRQLVCAQINYAQTTRDRLEERISQLVSEKSRKPFFGARS